MLSQHIGAICEPLVAKRDKVTAGQVIGKSDAFVSAPVHSPVNGTVKDIALQSHPVLGRAKAIIIDVDEEADNTVLPCSDDFGPAFDASKYTNQQIVDAVDEAGVVGLGGAGFPTRVKLLPNPKIPKEVMIINACECEPFITCDYRMMMEWSWQVLAGVELAAKAAKCHVVRIAIEDNKPEAIAVMTKAVETSKCTLDVKVVAVKTKYPQGGEKQLIKAVWGKDVPLGQIPPMIGIAVINVGTCAAIAEAVVLKRPLTHRVVTVTGEGVVKPGNFYVPVGITVGELIDLCGGLTFNAARIILGGPMMGFAIADLATPITKTSGAITILTEKSITKAKHESRATPCIRCGRCLEVCPAKINPTKIAHAVKHRELEIAQDYHMAACIECGCCSYICPANIEIKGYINTGKILLARANKKMPK
jgi:electron transport complex protein RnfC